MMKKRQNKVHFIGIGGIGMSALARWFLAQNWAVSGSDLCSSVITQDLKKEGVKVKIGHKKANLPVVDRHSPETTLVIYSQAVLPINPEFKEAKRRGVRTLSYPQALSDVSQEYKTIAVAGTHGKSTTTSLLSLILVKAGFDPTVIVGTKLRQFSPPAGGKNFRFGRSEYLVIEADEWKASFLNYSPAFAIITNVDREHLDYYKNFSNVKKAFLRFIRNIRPGGVLVLNKDNKNLYSLKSRVQIICKRHKVRVVWYYLTPNVSKKIKKVLKVPGTHNVSNALAAYTLARVLGISERVILQALGGYRGAWRRMELRGKLQIANRKSQIPVYDDYAHHPTEIKASLQGFREKFPKKKIICVFQPHQAHRLKNLFKEFTTAFQEVDYLILLPIYQVAGRDKVHKGYTSKDLAEKIKKRKLDVSYLPSPTRLRAEILNPKFEIRNSVIVMMGAGDIVEYTDLLVKK
ncbi:MAG: UDP-N-acetylmuramate--L-alanine ligase [Patescibacteria group bacterium]|nr:UDP-N-acetylmuramate--L-alanine ligase [Patescibacteria group bacterium]